MVAAALGLAVLAAGMPVLAEPAFTRGQIEPAAGVAARLEREPPAELLRTFSQLEFLPELLPEVEPDLEPPFSVRRNSLILHQSRKEPGRFDRVRPAHRRWFRIETSAPRSGVAPRADNYYRLSFTISF